MLPIAAVKREYEVLHHTLLLKPLGGTQSAAQQQAHYLAEWTTAMILIAVAARLHKFVLDFLHIGKPVSKVSELSKQSVNYVTQSDYLTL